MESPTSWFILIALILASAVLANPNVNSDPRRPRCYYGYLESESMKTGANDVIVVPQVRLMLYVGETQGVD